MRCGVEAEAGVAGDEHVASGQHLRGLAPHDDVVTCEGRATSVVYRDTHLLDLGVLNFVGDVIQVIGPRNHLYCRFDSP